jgi:hypothetical protein
MADVFLKKAQTGSVLERVIHVDVEVTPHCHSCPPSRRAIKHGAASEQLRCTLVGALSHDLGELVCHAHPDTPTHVRALVIGEQMVVQVEDACCEAFVRRLEACLAGELA